MAKYLLLGGPSDGERATLNGDPPPLRFQTVDTRAFEALLLHEAPFEAVKEAVGKVCTYKRYTLAAGAYKTWVYVHEDIRDHPDGWVLDRLIGGYYGSE